jgi:L-ascorbate metabolism protein UlaG (beta-lactamase superfamily)
MEITYLGHSSFKIKGKNATVVTDPFFPEMLGIKYPKTEADIVTVSHQHRDHNFIETIGGGPFIISLPGEYELKEVSVFGYPSYHDSKKGEERGQNTIFLIEIDGIKICHLGDLGGPLSPKTLDEVSIADILMIPVGGKVTLNAKEAVELIKQAEPLIVIPMHYKTPQLNQEKFGDLSDVDVFLKEMDATTPEKSDKLILTKDKLPAETKVILMERKI